MAIIKRTTNVGEDVEKRNPFICYWWKCELMQPLWKSVWWFLKELKLGLVEWPKQ
jgi:hypothetical protein